MARAKTKADEIYNARRRYRRKAENLIKKADKATGVTRERYQTQARVNLEKAMATYAEGSKPSGRMKELAESFKLGYESKGNIGQLVKESTQALLTKKLSAREQSARDILSIGNVASRFYGGLSEIWTETAETRKHPNQSILDFFGAKDLMEVIEQLEASGINIYEPEQNETHYRDMQLKIQEMVLMRKHEQEIF